MQARDPAHSFRLGSGGGAALFSKLVLGFCRNKRKPLPLEAKTPLFVRRTPSFKTCLLRQTAAISATLNGPVTATRSPLELNWSQSGNRTNNGGWGRAESPATASPTQLDLIQKPTAIRAVSSDDGGLSPPRLAGTVAVGGTVVTGRSSGPVLRPGKLLMCVELVTWLRLHNRFGHTKSTRQPARDAGSVQLCPLPTSFCLAQLKEKDNCECFL
jgi:hypothetical protein